jgi:uncharacterized membrane protein (Fun14 family)
VGGISGFCVGYAIKKIAKIIMIILSICYCGLECLTHIGVIEINHTALKEWSAELIGSSNMWQGILTAFFTQMPFSLSFTGGLVLGIKHG